MACDQNDTRNFHRSGGSRKSGLLVKVARRKECNDSVGGPDENRVKNIQEPMKTQTSMRS
jgi:hypothetical protein